MQPLPTEIVQQQIRSLLRPDLPWLVMGVVLLTMSASALALLCWRWKVRELALLWFGIFSGLYAVRLLAGVSTVRMLFDLHPASAAYLDAFITYVINLPFLAFIEQILGRGWRSSIRFTLWIWAAFSIAAVTSDLVQHAPRTASLPNNVLVLLMTLVLLPQVFWLRRPGIAGMRALKSGVLILMLFVVYENLRGPGILPWRTNVEPLGFFLFFCCLAYVAASRSLAREQRLKAIEQELETARRIQASILPRKLPGVAEIDLAVRYVPVASVAGDFYDFAVLDNRRLGLLVADVSGHGVPAALIASMVKVAFLSQLPHAADPARVLSGLNRILCGQLDGQFVTAAYLFLDLDTRTAVYSNAGHPPLLLWSSSQRQVREFQEGGLLLGFRPSAEYPVTELPLEPGDRLLLYTDGILEAPDRAGDFFGSDRLKESLAAHPRLSADRFAEALLDRLASWCSRRALDDDVTLVVVDLHGEKDGRGDSLPA